MIERRLRIAYISSASPADRHAWSGTHYYMFRALAKHCGDVVYLGPIPLYIDIFGSVLALMALASARVLNKTYLVPNNRFLCRLKGIFWAKKLSEGRFDLIFAPAASPDIAYLSTRIPVVYLGDATIALLWDYYPKFQRTLTISKKEADLVDRLAFAKSSLLVFSSQWAANSSINHYGANEDKVRVIPFGANIERIPSERSPRPRGHSCRLLFTGKDWVRKGGNLAFDTLLELEKMGLEAELIVCGCSPPKSLSHPNVKVIPWAKSIEDLLSEADFLLLPTRAECFGIVFCEASAYGVPIISTDTGGVSSAVTNGENGYLLDLSARAADYAKTILDVWYDDRLYNSLQEKSRKVFSERLNWDSWGKSMRQAINEVLELAN